ncbi:hypothetical protein QBC40DRAFT_324568 [Triangularia verruculosa]|uniref:Uncharacterized protein n=1 Tax=Triangularia verruculosa TaxID=2587418 RepID=A0AAN6XJD0_9PEZI|nr:hypothetical protein QBC40DRAFT_324568 [Triangularia verruculosa]
MFGYSTAGRRTYLASAPKYMRASSPSASRSRNSFQLGHSALSKAHLATNALFYSENAEITRSVAIFGLAVAFLSTGFGEAFLIHPTEKWFDDVPTGISPAGDSSSRQDDRPRTMMGRTIMYRQDGG